MSKLQQWLNSQGSTALWVVFWLYGVVLSNLLLGLILVAFNEVASSLFGLMLLGFVAYTASMLNAVWRNADNVRDPVHAQIARFLTVAWSINAVLVSGFLFLSHLNAMAFPLPPPF
ncbi:hypothetical protein [Pseudomonas fluorescens]|uniref:Transmembrane protein n=1 Tax=Pseudomonas fluorescens TaxID=294 RepID=A0A5E7ALC6_PSEFL|nr:hypothetical protein [Pseudomonas fluorescens]VVN80322.1 hypothetical protein PS704_01050 [Pseudomonas fluorescens]